MNVLLQQIGEQQLAGFILVLARVSPLFLLAPVFSSKMLPLRARSVAAVAISFGLAPWALHGDHLSLDVVTFTPGSSSSRRARMRSSFSPLA